MKIKKISQKINQILYDEYFYFQCKGFCHCCDNKVLFYSYDSWLRDNFYCRKCFSIPRERALMYIIETKFPHWRSLNIHESSPENRGASTKLKNNCKHYISTQFYLNNELGKVVNGIRNENLEEQTFKNESFDIVVTQDVMEHVLNPDAAFKEIARTLKPGGAHIFTTPLVNKFKPSQKWAVLDESKKLKFLFEPEYHGNPINPEGSPVSMHWGYDIIDFIYNSCGLKTEIIYLDNLDFGIRAEYIEVLISSKI
ncbi:MAG: class I SAM-dependent methyltransferase [Ignavibacteria bacterium]|nr:class I SAM-dependent methyltransferase [Ignavibacteria bacterium]